MVNIATAATENAIEANVLKTAFLHTLKSVEYHLGLHPDSPAWRVDEETARVMAAVCRKLLHHPEAPALADDLGWRRGLKRFRQLAVAPPPLDQREAVEHWAGVELRQARKAILSPLEPVNVS